MNTPICDFVEKYAAGNSLRLHMPGHKGNGFLGIEKLDITEISGADSLYEANSIIAESEKNASTLFGCDTFYSAEGSSLAIRAMLYLAVLHAKSQGKRAHIAAGRNAHKIFLSAAALLDFEITWLFPKENGNYLSCPLSAQEIDEALENAWEKPTAVYLTSPDYLGNTADIKAISAVCKKHGVLLLVDNAHGAYLRFLSDSKFPIDLGADMCCSSAHKTLPVITGGAYLHISENTSPLFAAQAKNALSLFGSTSPSYIILQSLDYANKVLDGDYATKLDAFAKKVGALKTELCQNGYTLVGNEILKLTVDAKKYGYTGIQFADKLSESGIVCEFADTDFAVMMLTPEIGDEGLDRLKAAMLAIGKNDEITQKAPPLHKPEKVLSVRSAALCECETVAVKESLGRILATATVSCPPAVPVVVSGEKIDEKVIEIFKYYSIENCSVIKK